MSMSSVMKKTKENDASLVCLNKPVITTGIKNQQAVFSSQLCKFMLNVNFNR